jgi:chaperonin GroEL (HSP60 family)
MDLKRGIDKAVAKVVENLKSQSQTVAMTSRKSNRLPASRQTMTRKIGKLIATAMDKVKKEGVITVEEAKGPRPRLRLLKVCSLTADTYQHILSPILTRWKLIWRIRISSFMTKRSHQ